MKLVLFEIPNSLKFVYLTGFFIKRTGSFISSDGFAHLWTSGNSELKKLSKLNFLNKLLEIFKKLKSDEKFCKSCFKFLPPGNLDKNDGVFLTLCKFSNDTNFNKSLFGVLEIILDIG
ncbi:MAG: hypothetical protein AB8B78_09475 [Polaribacter sp.]